MKVIHTVYDLKAEAYMDPFFSHNNSTALRDFTTAANQAEHIFNTNPEDYVLVRLGTYDDDTGRIEVLPEPLHLSTALEVKGPVHD